MHNCTQRCIELEGGYICDCNDGYTLNDDGKSCNGTVHKFCMYSICAALSNNPTLYYYLKSFIPVSGNYVIVLQTLSCTVPYIL